MSCIYYSCHCIRPVSFIYLSCPCVRPVPYIPLLHVVILRLYWELLSMIFIYLVCILYHGTRDKLSGFDLDLWLTLPRHTTAT